MDALLSIITMDINVLHFGSIASERLLKIRHWWFKNKEEKLISGSLRGHFWNFWQPLISPEARKEHSYQSFSASHMGPRADCPFHRPAFFRPALGRPRETVQAAKRSTIEARCRASMSINISSLKPRSNDRNMSTQHIATLLGALACIWPQCCEVLQHVGCCWLKFENGQI